MAKLSKRGELKIDALIRRGIQHHRKRFNTNQIEHYNHQGRFVLAIAVSDTEHLICRRGLIRALPQFNPHIANLRCHKVVDRSNFVVRREKICGELLNHLLNRLINSVSIFCDVFVPVVNGIPRSHRRITQAWHNIIGRRHIVLTLECGCLVVGPEICAGLPLV